MQKKNHTEKELNSVDLPKICDQYSKQASV